MLEVPFDNVSIYKTPNGKSSFRTYILFFIDIQLTTLGTRSNSGMMPLGHKTKDKTEMEKVAPDNSLLNCMLGVSFAKVFSFFLIVGRLSILLLTTRVALQDPSVLVGTNLAGYVLVYVMSVTAAKCRLVFNNIVLFFFFSQSIDVQKKVLKVLSLSPGHLPSPYLLLGSIKFLDV